MTLKIIIIDKYFCKIIINIFERYANKNLEKLQK